MASDEGGSAIRFTTPVDNDFQWYNLYMRQFGTSSYPPPMPKNPSTTSAQYPTQRDVAVLMATEMSPRAAKALAKTSPRRPAKDDDFDDEFDDGDGEARAPEGSQSRLSTLDTLTDLLDGDDLFSPNFFDFLRGPDGTSHEIFSVLLSPRSQRVVNDQSFVSAPFRRHSMPSDTSFYPGGGGGRSDGDVIMPAADNADNPHRLPREVYNLQSEAWTLLLDNRALAWLQREAAEKGKSATMVRLQLLHVATRSGYVQAGQLSQGLSKASAAMTAPTAPLLTAEQSFQRVYESFSPFFAILSPPTQVKRLREQYQKAVRAQKAGRRGPVADMVGLPIFSQYATWREAYEHRKVWPCSPFSFFLIHDQSYNFAHVSAIYVLIGVIKAHMHRHAAHCTDTSTSTIDLEMAGNLLSRARTARHQVAMQRQLCPYRVMEQMTENLIIAFESSDAKCALTMVSQVCRFLTDCALDEETAARFLDRRALLRQAQFEVPGLNVASAHLKRDGSGPPAAFGRVRGSTAPMDSEEDEDDEAAAAAAHDAAGELEMLFALRHFGESEFNALFDLNTWFLDAATANVRVPIDHSLCPPPRLLVHPGQVGGMAFPINDLSASSPALSSVSAGSTQSRQTANRARNAATASEGGSPRLPALSPRVGLTTVPPTVASPLSPGTHHQVPREHRYIPGRHQQYLPVGSLVQALIRFETRREQLLQAKSTLLTTMRSGTHGAGAHSSFSVASVAAVSSGVEEAAGAASEGSGFPMTGSVRDNQDSTDRSAVPPNNSSATAGADLEGSRRQPPSPVPEETAQGTGEDGNSGLSESTTVLASPLIILSTYIRLHGAAWLKNLLDRLFNVLRRESVLLYVNRLDLEASTNVHGAPVGVGTSRRSSTGCPSPIAVASGHTSAAPTAAGLNVQHLLDGLDARMARLEDLITQDIQYVMNEFLSALHGRRSATRLPQGITTLITQFCSTVHLHLLRDVLVSASEGSEGRPGSAARRVAEHVHTLKQKRVAAKTMRNDVQANQRLDQLLLSIEQYRLAKFLLFDSWIIPALNNAVALGYLPDNAPLHLRWNVDAFARYLKILVNAPFTAANARAAQLASSSVSRPSGAMPEGSPLGPDTSKLLGKTRAVPSPPSPFTPNPTPRTRARRPSATSPSATPGPSGSRKKRAAKEATAPPDEMALPPYITGIYDVSSGTLIRLHDPAVAVGGTTPVAPGNLEASTALESSRGLLTSSAQFSSRDVSVTLPTMATSRTMMPHQPLRQNSMTARSPRRGGGTGRYAKVVFPDMDDAAWELLSPTLQSLNDVLGIVGYDPEDDAALFHAQPAAPGLEENCAMRVLDLFCQRASAEGTSNVVVSEFEVLPSVATGCIEKVFDFVAGKHPLVEQAMDAKVLPSDFSFSPYLAALTGVLLHPMVASQALDNVYHNSPRFYDTLMRPVEDETMLKLVSALVVDQGGAALVDCNALSPLLASQRGAPRGADGSAPSLASRYNDEVRRLVRCKTFLATGAQTRVPVTGHSYADQIQRMTSQAGPMDPRTLLEAGRDRVAGEAGFVPTCFDVWWRSMTLAMTVKVITVLVECTAVQSNRFLEWCQQKLDVNKREYRLLTEAFTRDKGGETLTDPGALRDLEAAMASTPVKRKTVARGQPGSMTSAAKKKRATKAAAKGTPTRAKKKATPSKSRAGS